MTKNGYTKGRINHVYYRQATVILFTASTPSPYWMGTGTTEAIAFTMDNIPIQASYKFLRGKNIFEKPLSQSVDTVADQDTYKLILLHYI